MLITRLCFGRIAIASLATICAASGVFAGPGLAAVDTAHPFVPLAVTSDTLYDNTGIFVGETVSSNYETKLDAYDSEIADDFEVPKRTIWSVDEVDVVGDYLFGHQAGPARSEHVVFYKDAGGKPGAVIKEYRHLEGADDAGSFSIAIPRTFLKPGHYWLSVVADIAFWPDGVWAWRGFPEANGYPAQFQNPGDGYGTGCTTWSQESICAPYGEVDNFFMLKGKSISLP